ncbi:hypothetical protein NPIL_499631 [Nephila pilipes]|uniref:Uncharacterized protein n=1 Tax=Nephila pilipes TaxID=299642 RepID=A0A8X6UDL0_NEPPI|nr:hypothetical protein NPIL_499631 [Nephila pilipes]
MVWIHPGFQERAIFFEESTPAGPNTCSVNGIMYRNMLPSFLIPELQQPGCLQSTGFMQNPVKPNNIRSVQTFSKRHLTKTV